MLPAYLVDALRPLAGARVALIAPAGGVKDERIDTVRAVMDAAGIETCLGEHARDHHRYLAGTADDRLRDLQAAFELPNIDAVWCLRGGYGTAQFVQAIDWARIPREVPLIGYSDMSLLLAAFEHRSRRAIHAPVATELALPGDTPAEQAERAASMTSLVACLQGQASEWPLLYHSGPSNRLTGRVVGGNLTTLASVAGTPAALTLADDAILVLEDVGEAEFRLERCLQQLLDSLDTRHMKAICLGRFERCALACGMESLVEIFAEYSAARGIALYYDAPVGHGCVNHAWRYGSTARIKADRLRIGKS
ncbi:Murein tetrapeptide carboxypeptidase protein [Salinisphaera shabanensis E1L3A]|uniref:Murein tetrapeptide carboxypeptidase protein n=2 Tax=Salinisphaera shabanensis TaxID=180542 RepID=U2G3E5_9GAMM|nr:Murein tetrapeptide carboxypeptidase protein [Salinisphaera shabanensis E1L3A]